MILKISKYKCGQRVVLRFKSYPRFETDHPRGDFLGTIVGIVIDIDETITSTFYVYEISLDNVSSNIKCLEENLLPSVNPEEVGKWIKGISEKSIETTTLTEFPKKSVDSTEHDYAVLEKKDRRTEYIRVLSEFREHMELNRDCLTWTLRRLNQIPLGEDISDHDWRMLSRLSFLSEDSAYTSPTIVWAKNHLTDLMEGKIA